jgi:iron complex transport system substrate-binding protein
MFYQVWGKPLFTLNGQHIVSDAIRICGGINIFDTMKTTAPIVSIEAVLQADPEVIVGTEEKQPSDGGVAMWKRYPLMTAVKRGSLFLLNEDLLSRAGPRTIEGAAALCEALDIARSRRSAR